MPRYLGRYCHLLFRVAHPELPLHTFAVNSSVIPRPNWFQVRVRNIPPRIWGPLSTCAGSSIFWWPVLESSVNRIREVKTVVCRKRELDRRGLCEVETWSKMEEKKTARCIYSECPAWPPPWNRNLCAGHVQEDRRNIENRILFWFQEGSSKKPQMKLTFPDKKLWVSLLYYISHHPPRLGNNSQVNSTFLLLML